MEISPVILEGQHVRLEPLSAAHEEALVAAASDGELWRSTVTVVPSRATMASYIEAALLGQTMGHELPFVIVRKTSGEAVGPMCQKADGRGGLVEADAGKDAGGPPAGMRALPGRALPNAGASPGKIVGTTRFYDIQPNDRRVAIGYTWLSLSAQRTAVNTESKLLLLTHAFEHWRCNRVELITDVLNQQSRAAILRLGAKEEGVFRQHMMMPDGRIRDSVCFSIIVKEWPEVKARLATRLGRSPSHEASAD